MNWFSKRKVIAPVDFSDESFAAVKLSLQLVANYSDLTIVHVLRELPAGEPGETWGTIDRDSRVRHATQAVRERLEGGNYKDVQIDVLFGDAGLEIANLAERKGAGMIVLSSHGRTGIKRLLIGSVAERVVRLAHCPVLVLRS
jgi:nucleotide-binding universal stress UspA family protein